MSAPGIQTLIDNLRRTSAAEWAAVATGFIYIVLIIRRNRWGWLAGGISSLLFVVVCARSKLPMQALLQASYVAGAVYGWWSWAPESKPERISLWTLRGHLLVIVLCVLVSLGLRRFLVGESAFPFMDSLVACCGLFATWLVARVKLENWLYWIVIDAISIYLYMAQGLAVTAGLFAIYMVMAAAGLRSWWRIRATQAAAPTS
ncbi:MAG: nicotinamide riboside transporter PnuC [Pseudomonadota bacterium]